MVADDQLGCCPHWCAFWMRARGPLVRAWRSTLGRNYIYGGAGKGAQRAAWMQAARAEIAHMEARCYGVVLVDLVKAFERVPHARVAHAAARCGYPMWVLRLSLDAYRMDRTVVIDGTCSRTIVATQGITAGSGFASEELCCLMLDVMDEVVASAPQASLTLYVDDATAEASGSRRQVAATLARATAVLADGVAAVGLEVSTSKSVVVASHRRIRRRVGRTRASCGGRLVRDAHVAKMLGCGTAGGRRRSTHVQQLRLKRARVALPRIAALRRAGVSTACWWRTAGNPSMLYGTDTLGVADTVLHSQRRVAAAAVSAPGAGKQMDAILWMADAVGNHSTDPAFAAHEMPVVSLARAVWDGWISPVLVARALGWAQHRVLEAAATPWSRTAGPFAAVIASLHRLAWTYDTGLAFVTDEGVRIDFSIDSPKAIQLTVRRSVWRWRDRRIAAQLPGLDHGGVGLVTFGVAAASRPPRVDDALARHWSRGCFSALRSAVVNGQWPQARLHQAGLATEASCRLCGERAGTLLHRRECATTAPFRGSPDPPPAARAAWAVLSDKQRDILSTRGLLAEIDLSRYPVSPHEVMRWHMQPADGILLPRWTAYLDGSLRDGPDRRTGRAGWAFVALDDTGAVVAAAFGVPPPWIRCIHGAELWALYAALRCSLPGVAFRSDRLAVVRTFRRGRAFATRYSEAYARLWRMIFTAFDDFDSPEIDIDIEWMPAHTVETDVGTACLTNGQLLSAADRHGNDLADSLAKQGAELHRLPAPVLEAFNRQHLLSAWAARELAVRTFVANDCPCVPGRTATRDSDGFPRWRRPAQVRQRTPPAPVLRAQPPKRRRPSPAPSASSSTSSTSSETEALCVGRARRRRVQAAHRAHAAKQQLADAVEQRVGSARPGLGNAAVRLASLRERVRARALA